MMDVDEMWMRCGWDDEEDDEEDVDEMWMGCEEDVDGM